MRLPFLPLLPTVALLVAAAADDACEREGVCLDGDGGPAAPEPVDRARLLDAEGEEGAPEEDSLLVERVAAPWVSADADEDEGLDYGEDEEFDYEEDEEFDYGSESEDGDKIVVREGRGRRASRSVNTNADACHNVKIQFKVDKYGEETTVLLTGGGRTHLGSIKKVGAHQTETLTGCVPPGTYKLTLIDQDGICCRNGRGWYKMFVGGHLVISGAAFDNAKSGRQTHTIEIGSNWQASMSTRDKAWLNSHNSRRRKYNGGQGYVPLRWSQTLKADALKWAKKLVSNCNEQPFHAKDIEDGENISGTKGKNKHVPLDPADKIVGRFVERELNWPWPKNSHYTQVVWRATQYVGCADAVNKVSDKLMCRTYVCRYTRAGNCGVPKDGNWEAVAWKDLNRCGRECPDEGCFA